MSGPLGLADDHDFFERLARHAGVRFAVLDPEEGGQDPVDHRAAALVGWPTARAFGVLPIGIEAGRLVVAVADPFVVEPVHVVAELTRREVTAAVATPAAIARAQDRVFGPRPEGPGGSGHVPGTVPRTRPEGASEEERARAERLADGAGLEFTSLDEVDEEAARSLPEPVCRHLSLVPIARDTNRMTIAVADPADDVPPRVVYALTGDIPRIVVAAPRDIERALVKAFAPQAEGHTSP